MAGLGRIGIAVHLDKDRADGKGILRSRRPGYLHPWRHRPGKDLGFLPLAMATVFQLIFGMLFIYCAFAVVQRIRRGKRIMLLVTVQMILLLLFPLWLGFYTAGVINNSDGAAADLRVYPHIGLVVYAALLVLVANTLYRSSQGRTVDGPPPG